MFSTIKPSQGQKLLDDTESNSSALNSIVEKPLQPVVNAVRLKKIDIESIYP